MWVANAPVIAAQNMVCAGVPTIKDAGATLPLFAMKKDSSPRKVLAISSPTCGAAPGEKCQLISGQPRTEPHRDRRLLAKD